MLMLLSTLSNSPGNSVKIQSMACCNKPSVIILNPEISGTISVIIFKGNTLETLINFRATYRNPVAKQQCWNFQL